MSNRSIAGFGEVAEQVTPAVSAVGEAVQAERERRVLIASSQVAELDAVGRH